jgi:hypothetical protein
MLLQICRCVITILHSETQEKEKYISQEKGTFAFVTFIVLQLNEERLELIAEESAIQVPLEWIGLGVRLGRVVREVR